MRRLTILAFVFALCVALPSSATRGRKGGYMPGGGAHKISKVVRTAHPLPPRAPKPAKKH